MRSLMHVVRESGSFVFLDGPPAKGSPDARLLSELADLVVLVVGHGKATPEDVASAVAMFEPTKFAGVVFNRWETKGQTR
jgi:protein-tyrosine kinase